MKEIDNPDMRALADYLESLATGGCLPDPADFDILAVRRMAGFIHMVDVLAPASDGPGEASGLPCFRFAIYGTRWGEITGGAHYQGQEVDRLTPDERRRRFKEVLMRTLAERQPRFERDVLPGRRGASWPGGLPFVRLVWPMSRDCGTIDRILLAALPDEKTTGVRMS